MRNALRKTGWLLVGVLLAVVLLEAVLRVLPVSKGMHRSLDFDRWPLQYAAPHSRYDYSIGWMMRNAHSGMTNNYGHVAPFDFRKSSHPVLVIGDSYIESLMNDYTDTLQAQLAERLGDPHSVYGLGVSGASASGYIGIAKLARQEFAPRAAVFMITDGDLSESIGTAVGSHLLSATADGRLELVYRPLTRVPLSTRVRNVIGDSSLHRYLQANLQFAPENIVQALHGPVAVAPTTVREDDAPRTEMQKRVADWFLDELARSTGLTPNCIVLLLDDDRYAIYKPALASIPKDTPAARTYLAGEARRRGFQVSDLGPIFRDRYARDRQKFDHYPIDRHWNRHGHGIAASEAARLLGNGGCTAPARSAP